MTARQGVGMAVLVVGQLLLLLAVASVSVSLPMIQHDLALSDANRGWVITAYALPLGGLALVAGRLGEVGGRRRVHVAGLLLFALGSVIVATASGMGVLLTGRVVAGIGAAAASAGAVGLLESLALSARARTLALTAWFTAGAVGFSTGALFGGFLLEQLAWRMPFFGYAALALLLACGALLLPEGRPDRSVDLGLLRALLGSLGLIALAKAAEALLEGGSAARLGWSAAAVVLLCLGFLPARLPKDRLGQRTAVVITVWMLDAAFFGLSFPVLIALQEARGLSPLDAGSVLAATAAGAVLGAALLAPLAEAAGLRWTLLAGTALAAVGLWTVAHGGLARPLPQLAFALALSGFGAGGAIAAVCGALDRDRLLTASGLNRTRGLAFSLGTAAIPAVMDRYEAGHPPLGVRGPGGMSRYVLDVVSGGLSQAYVLVTVFALVGAVLVASTRSRRPEA